MSRGKTLCIHDMFNNIMVEYQNDLICTDREEQQQSIERRPWVVALLKFLSNAHAAVSNNRYWHNLFCCMQMMVTVFASLSITWSALANLAYFGLSGPVYKFCVAAIMIMSCYTCLLAAVQYIKFGLDGNRLMRYQKMRSIEIKLFRSPDIPSAKYSKTKALIEYMNYYSVEKSVFKMINEVWTKNTRIATDTLQANWIPIELKTRMALVMRARKSSVPETNQRRICRLIRDEFSRVYNTIIQESSSKRFEKHHYIKQLYDIAAHDSISSASIDRLCPEKNCGPDEWIAKVIVAYTIARFAFFARKHGDEQSDMLIKEANGHWMKLSARKIENQKMKAFRWSIKQHLKRQNKKVSSVNVGHFLMSALKTCFIICAASIPAGFGLLASSPVAAIIGWLGGGWSCQLCAWFWFSGVVDYMNTSRKDAEKIWIKVCEFVDKNFIQKESKNPLIEQHTWSFSLDICFRIFVAFSMACARSLFTYNSVKKLIKNPASIGGQKLFYRLFKLLLPWLEPLFLPLCASLSFIDGVLHYAQITKYYSAKHLPRPLRGDLGTTDMGHWGRVAQQVKYLWCHNFDFSKRMIPKLLKLVGTVIGLLQSMVLYVSAQQVLGSMLALCLMPGVALVIVASNRRCIEAGTDLWHHYMHSDFFDINLQNKYRSWFRIKRDQRIRDPIHRSSTKSNHQANQSRNLLANSLRQKQQAIEIVTKKENTQAATSLELHDHENKTQSHQNGHTTIKESEDDNARQSESSLKTVNRFGVKNLHVTIDDNDSSEVVEPQLSSDDVIIDGEASLSEMPKVMLDHQGASESSLSIVPVENEREGQSPIPTNDSLHGTCPPAFFTPKREYGQRDTQTPGTDRESMASLSPRSAPGTPMYNSYRKMFGEIKDAITADKFKQLEYCLDKEPSTAALIIHEMLNEPSSPKETETDANRQSPRSINHSASSLHDEATGNNLSSYCTIHNSGSPLSCEYEDPITEDDEEVSMSLISGGNNEPPITRSMTHTEDDRPLSRQSDCQFQPRPSSRLSRPSSRASNGNRSASRSSMVSPFPLCDNAADRISAKQ